MLSSKVHQASQNHLYHVVPVSQKSLAQSYQIVSNDRTWLRSAELVQAGLSWPDGAACPG